MKPNLFTAIIRKQKRIDRKSQSVFVFILIVAGKRYSPVIPETCNSILNVLKE